MEKRLRSIIKASLSVDADVRSVSNWKCRVTSTTKLKPIAVTFRDPSPLKKSKSEKRSSNENVNVNEVLPPNEVPAGLQTLRDNEEGEHNDNDDDEDDDEKLLPLHVFFDIEAMKPARTPRGQSDRCRNRRR